MSRDESLVNQVAEGLAERVDLQRGAAESVDDHARRVTAEVLEQLERLGPRTDAADLAEVTEFLALAEQVEQAVVFATGMSDEIPALMLFHPEAVSLWSLARAHEVAQQWLCAQQVQVGWMDILRHRVHTGTAGVEDVRGFRFLMGLIVSSLRNASRRAVQEQAPVEC